MNQAQKLDFLISYMQQEKDIKKAIPQDKKRKFEQFRGLANTRPPNPLKKEFLQVQDAFLQEYNQSHITHFDSLIPIKKQIYLWQGDITTLKIDAIVNAANSEMLGCLLPNHNCIDNIIHTKAGAQLRLKCNEIMIAQEKKEAVGRAKITPGYNLPADFIIHTVGPYINNRVSSMSRDLLSKSYNSCLELADQNNIKSIAFCSISTGVFGFPKREAANIAIETVNDYLKKTNSEIQVVFNVFNEENLKIYKEILN